MNESVDFGVPVLNMALPFISTAFIVPFVGWLKKKIPGDLPISTDLISGVLSYLCVAGFNYVLGLGLIPEIVLGMSGVLWKLNGTVHAAWKTKKKSKPITKEV